jgi:hypothetical protein
MQAIYIVGQSNEQCARWVYEKQLRKTKRAHRKLRRIFLKGFIYDTNQSN